MAVMTAAEVDGPAVLRERLEAFAGEVFFPRFGGQGSVRRVGVLLVG
jgi:hypothetical protein